MPEAIAFLSYVRSDDEHEAGQLSAIREKLSAEVQLQTGDPFPIFQDRNDIEWGQHWKTRLEEGIDAATFLIPIVTPSFFKSEACRGELTRFINHERALGRTDLVLPLYYVTAPVLGDDEALAADELARFITERNWADWRDLRFEPLTSPQVRKTIATLATQIVSALGRVRAPASAPPSRKLAEPTEQAPEQSAVTRNEPPVVVVDPLHRGDYVSLQEAVEHAEPGTRILVRPGLYAGVEIDKPLEVIGDGERAEIVVEGRESNAILFRTTMGRVANISIRQRAGEKQLFAVNVVQGRLEIEDCDITSESGAAIGVSGGADPRMRRNLIHDCAGTGISLGGGAGGIVEDNEIRGCVDAIWVSRRASPTFRRNVVDRARGDGITIFDGGGTFDSNEITGGQRNGAWILEAADATFRNNVIRENGGVAIKVNAGKGGTFIGNDLRGNAGGAWEIVPGLSDVERRDNLED